MPGLPASRWKSAWLQQTPREAEASYRAEIGNGPTATGIVELENGIPLVPIHAGLTIAAELSMRQLTPHRDALQMPIPLNRVSQILAG
jgi:hypothetical protein